MSGVDELPRFLDAGTTLADADARAAALLACGYATDADDARLLLDALGLLGPPPG